jgi:5'-nucleotidase
VAHYEDLLDEVPGIFSLMNPMPGAIESFEELSMLYDTYILYTATIAQTGPWPELKRYGAGIKTV